MRKQVWLILTALALVTAGVAAYYRNSAGSTDPAVTSTAVTRGSIVSTVAATGTLEAVTTVQVGTQVSGTIKTLYADYNSQVKKGQVVAELEPSLFQTQVDGARATVLRLEADVERAKVELADAQAKARRAEELSARQLIPATDLETARTTALQAQAALKSAEAQVVQSRASLNQNQVNLSHTIITAPIDGVVISRSVAVGQTVAASMQAPTLFVIAQDLKRLQVNAKVDESDIGHIETGQHVEFLVDAYPGQTFSGSVKQVRLEPVIDQNVVSYVTIIDAPNAELKLKPGMTANVTFETARADDVLRVPNSALAFRPTAELFKQLGQEIPARRDSADPAAGRGDTNQAAPSGRPDLATGQGNRARQGALAPGARRPGGEPSPAVWALADGHLTRIRVETGLTDGTTTAIVGGDLQEGAQVVTGVTVPASTSARPAGSASPLLPRFGNRGGQTRPAQGGAR